MPEAHAEELCEFIELALLPDLVASPDLEFGRIRWSPLA
jgi:hypothetical protein